MKKNIVIILLYSCLLFMINGDYYIKNNQQHIVEKNDTIISKKNIDYTKIGYKLSTNSNNINNSLEKETLNKVKDKTYKIVVVSIAILLFQIMIIILIHFLIIKKIINYKKIKISNKKITHVLGENSYKNRNCKFEKGNRIIEEKDVPYYRDIITNRDIFRDYWIIYNYYLGENDFDFFGTLLLKWINDDNIKIELDNNNKFKNIIFVNNPKNCNEVEYKLYHYLFQASFGNEKLGFNVDNKLDVIEFKNWYLENYGKITNWFSSILDYEVDNLIKENKITIEKKKVNNIYKISYIVDPSMREDAIKLMGLKKFMKDFTILKDRETMEVKLFNKYLMYATMFGITNKVYKELQEIYPKIIDFNPIEEESINFIVFMLK